MADQPALSVNVIRYDPGHRGRHDPHANVDPSLWFRGDSGQAYRLSFDEHLVHYRRLSADTGLDVVPANLGVPLRPSGPLSDLRCEQSVAEEEGPERHRGAHRGEFPLWFPLGIANCGGPSRSRSAWKGSFSMFTAFSRSWA